MLDLAVWGAYWNSLYLIKYLFIKCWISDDLKCSYIGKGEVVNLKCISLTIPLAANTVKFASSVKNLWAILNCTIGITKATFTAHCFPNGLS